MRTKVRFEIQEREDLAHMSVEGWIICQPVEFGTLVHNVRIAAQNQDKFQKLVLTALFNEENHFDFIILETAEDLPGLVQIWPENLFEYFDIPRINEE